MIRAIRGVHGIRIPHGAQRGRSRETEAMCRAGTIGCVQCKKNLYSKMAEKLMPIYEKRQELLSRHGYIREVVENGNARAAKTAQKTMAEVRKAMKIDW